MEEKPEPKQSTWQRLLDNKTSWQRFVLAAGALAAALAAIGGLVAGIGALLGDDADRTGSATSTTQPTGVTVVTSQDPDADEFVRFLLGTEGAPVQLDHKVFATDEGAFIRLEYDCAKHTGCSFTRLEAAAFIPDRIEGGVWYQGCFSVVRDGPGFGAEHLDLEFTRNGDTCPS